MNRSKKKNSRLFHVEVSLFTGERFRVEECSSKMLVVELKERLELVIGIPVNLQRLSYLDAADLMDNQPLKYIDIIPGALIKATVWNQWVGLVEAVCEGDIFKALRQGVTKDSKYNDANSSTMMERTRSVWLQERANVALYIASHRGHDKMVVRLLLSGSNVSWQTPVGRSPLHVAGSQGHVKSLLSLLQFGAKSDTCDKNGETPLTMSARLGQRQCERHLFMHEWQQRAAKIPKYVDNRPLMAHQMYDTHQKTWYSGRYRRIYTAEILPPGEFSGSRINAPKRVPVAPRSFTAPEKAKKRSPKISTLAELDKEAKDEKLEKQNRETIKQPLMPYLEKTHALRDHYAQSMKFLRQRNPKEENWISRRPETIMEHFGVGIQD